MLDARQAQRHRTEASGGVATQGAARSRHCLCEPLVLGQDGCFGGSHY
jgi:hypothetical protein